MFGRHGYKVSYNAYIANEFICHCLFQIAHLLSVDSDILKRHIPYHAVPA